MPSRRQFLKLAAAAAFASLVPRPLTVAAATQSHVPSLPWPYTRLDPEETRRLGHLGYYAFECAGGAFWAIAIQLVERIGYPWTLLPLPSREDVVDAVNRGEHHPLTLMQFGHGGVVGWATTCGALIGALALVNMVVRSKKDMDMVGRALMRWYETAPFPSVESNAYAVRGEMYPRKLKSSKWLPQSVSGSVLCHVSVSKWCRVSGYASGSSERSERCARLTGDVAAKTVELLNAYFEGRLGEILRLFALSPYTASCRVCHFKGRDYELGQFTRGYLACESCHRDLRGHVAEPQGRNVVAVEALVASGLAAAAAGLVVGFASARRRGR